MFVQLMLPLLCLSKDSAWTFWLVRPMEWVIDSLSQMGNTLTSFLPCLHRVFLHVEEDQDPPSRDGLTPFLKQR